jgi:Outer membrane protein beta-barrel domain
MNERDFDKLFSEELTVEEDFQFTEHKWGKMEKHLDGYLATRRRGYFWWLLSIPFLGLFWLLNSAQKDIQNLTSEIRSLKEAKVAIAPPSSLSSIKNDTIYKHIVIKRYDTIYQTVVRREVLNSNDVAYRIEKPILKNNTIDNTKADVIITPKSNKSEGNKLDTANATIEAQNIAHSNLNSQPSNPSTPLSILGKKQLFDTTISKKDSVKDFEKRADITEKTNTDSLKNEKTQTDSSKNIVVTATLEDNKQDTVSQSKIVEKEDKKGVNISKKLLPILKPMRLSAYEVGATSGWATIGGDNISNQGGYSLGVKAGVGLGNHFKIVGETQYIGLGFETNRLNDRLNIPPINPPTTNDVFRNVRVEQPYIHYSLGLHYAFSIKRFKPYVGVSALGQSKLEEKFNYRFINNLTREDITIKTSRHDGAFQMSYLRTHLGVSYPILEKWSAQLEGTYDFKINDNKSKQDNSILQLKGGILYRF